MNLRKFLYLPTDEQKLVLLADVKRIVEGCADIASTEWKELKENQKSHDGQCPRCKDKGKIVDKINHVQGISKVTGKFYFGFGTINTVTTVDTIEVNHCHNCGHEWKKFKTKYISATDIMRVALNYLGDIYGNPDHNMKKYWKHEAIQVFDKCSAEAIHLLVKKHEPYMRNTTKKVVTMKMLRKHYDSIFDKN